MRVAFAGTPAFAARALEALLEAGHQVGLVLTQPDRPAGRGLAPQPSPVKAVAIAHGLPVCQPPALRSEEERAPLAQAAAQVLVVAAYGLILPPAVLALPPLGCVNIHASLLPRWRGAAPIQRALLAGDAETGISIMQMDAGLDTGPVLLQRALSIAPDETAGSLERRLAALGARCIVEALDALERGAVTAQPQDAAQASYAAKISKEEAWVDWSRHAHEIERAIRAFQPVPGAVTTLRGERLKLWRARVAEGVGAPGEVLRADADGVVVACGAGSALVLLEVQRAGARRMNAAEFLRGMPLRAGDRLGR